MSTAVSRIFLLILLVSCLAGMTKPASATEAEAEFPEVPGWTRATEVRTFGPDELWRYINGAAELFLAYDVRLLRACDLAAGERTVSVSIFDMGTRLNAFGIYGTEKSASAEPLDIGVEAVVAVPYQGLMLKDAFYVKAESWKGDLAAEDARSLLQEIAAALPGSEEPPAELALLPAEGKVPHSEGYTREGFLGLQDLRNCVHADYADGDGNRYQGFRLLADPGRSLDETWEELAARWQEVPDTDPPLLIRKIPYQGPVGLARTEEGIFGVTGPKQEARLIEVLNRTALAR